MSLLPTIQYTGALAILALYVPLFCQLSVCYNYTSLILFHDSILCWPSSVAQKTSKPKPKDIVFPLEDSTNAWTSTPTSIFMTVRGALGATHFNNKKFRSMLFCDFNQPTLLQYMDRLGILRVCLRPTTKTETSWHMTHLPKIVG